MNKNENTFVTECLNCCWNDGQAFCVVPLTISSEDNIYYNNVLTEGVHCVQKSSSCYISKIKQQYSSSMIIHEHI